MSTIAASVCAPGTYHALTEADGAACAGCPQGTWSKQWEVRDAAQCLVCPPGVAFADIMDGINRARTYVAAMCCGMVAQALATASAYGQARQAFGKPLAHHQGWRWQLAQAAIALKAGDLLVADACIRIDQGADVQAEAA